MSFDRLHKTASERLMDSCESVLYTKKKASKFEFFVVQTMHHPRQWNIVTIIMVFRSQEY